MHTTVNRISTLAMYAFLCIVLVFALMPLVFVLFASFKSNQEILAHASRLLPIEWTFQNYKEAWTLANFKRYTWNSVYMTAFIVFGTLLVSTMAGYVFARGRFPGKATLFAAFTATMFLSFGSITLYPLLQIAKILHLNTSLWGVIVISIFGMHIANIFIIRSFVNSIPYEVDEAAIIDGCSFFRTFWNIILPLMKPVIATIGIITFKYAWNEFLLPMVFTLSNPDQRPLSVGIVALRSAGEAASSWNLMLAGTMLSVVPMLAVYLILNRYFVAGLTSGAIKG
ncbi:carbohydrate ABC transporter permease [Cohnella phaseoli]|uniref:ABC-type glycerol-3-phosphate transport system permease component n=1 Tax=Cohnella phaseoli TaxID=456490 RepID=A0A3D9JUJ7_9BACL|nr:carbohydrate ABC transporter permease [Cohnella phaseoli]RED77590.1 ABC-type glycerol-3-phosphate transport system permease component [Cohnella phaseoli]